MSRPVVEYELDTDSSDVRPAFLRWKDQLNSADLYELTMTLFWADIRFRHDSGELRWRGPILEFVFELENAGHALLKGKKYLYSASEGVAEIEFRRRGGDVLILGEIPAGRARMTLPVFVEFAAEHLELVLKDLCGRFPALARNQDILKLKARASGLRDAARHAGVGDS